MVNDGAKNLVSDLQQKMRLKTQLLKAVVDLDSYKPKKDHKPGHWVKGLSRVDKAVFTNGS